VVSKVHSALRPPMAYCASPGWLWWWWRNLWNDWQGKPKYSEKTCPSAALSTKNPTCCPDANPGRRGGKPAANRLSYGAAEIRMSDNPDRNMKNAVHSWVHTLKDTWHLGRQMSHLSVQTKLETVSSNLQYYVQNKYKFWVFYRWINVMSFYSF
jgi:hypothetical protein